MQGNCAPGRSLRAGRPRSVRRLIRGVAAASAAVLIAPSLRANNVYTATGPGGYWSNSGTWVSNTVPTGGIDTELDFGGAAADANTFTDDLGTGTFTLNEIQLNSTSTGTQTIAPNASANTLTFASNGLLAAPQILQNGSGAYVINNGLVLNNTLTLGGSGTGALTLGGILSGTGGLTLNGPYTVTLTGQNSFTGNITINGGVLQAAVAASNPNSPYSSALGTPNLGSRTIAVNNGGQLVFATSDVFGSSTTSGPIPSLTINAGGVVSAAAGTHNILGTITLNGGTLLTNIGSSPGYGSFYLSGRLVNVGGSQPSAITLSGSTNNGIHLGSGMAGATIFNVANVTADPRPDLTISAPLFDAPSWSAVLRKDGAGTLSLTANNTYSGGTSIGGGVLDLNAAGSLAASSSLTFYGTGSFVYENSGAKTSHSQHLSAITFYGGDATVEVDDNAGQVIALIPEQQLSQRSAGATGNFVVRGSANPSQAEIAPINMTAGFIDQGTFFNGSNYAWVDNSSSVLRGIDYGTVQSHALTDPGAFTFSGGSTVTPVALSVSYAQTTGSISGQATATLKTLNLASNDVFSLASGATLIVNGILKSGNVAGGATISGGTGIHPASGAELVIRTDGPDDALTINTPVFDSGTVTPVTKSGLGTLTFGGVNTYTGTTVVNAGTVAFSGNGGSSGGGMLSVGGASGTATLNIATAGTVAFNSVNVGGVAGSISIAGAGAINQSAGTFNYVNGHTSGILLGAGTNEITGANWGGYGAYTLSGGTLAPGAGAGDVVVGSIGLGNFTQSGGNFVLGGRLTVGDLGTGTVTLTGGTVTGATSDGVILGGQAGANGTFNLGTLAGGNTTFLSQSSHGVLVGVAGSTGQINLNAGTLALNAGSIHQWSGASALLNWNGATLQAAATGLTLIDNSVNAVNVFNGGAVVDTQGYNATIAAPLLGTVGNGIYPSGGTLNVAAGGAGYIGAPLVTVSGGAGTGATAIANQVNGAITGVTLTSPGQNYQPGDVLTFTFAGGGATTPAAAASYTLQVGDIALNSVGGLKKLGSGTLVLTGASTYTGATNVVAGTLQVDGSLGNTPVNVAPGATLAGKGTIANAGANAVTIAGTVAPGDANTMATLSTGPMTWAPGGTYTWKVSQLPAGSSSGGAGVNWDSLLVSSLSVTATNLAGSQFTITPVGNPPGVQPGNTYRWQIAQVGPAGGPVGGFDPGKFVLNTSQFAGGAYPPSDFSIANTGNEVDVVFSPAPEPSSLMLVGAAAGAVMMRRRRGVQGARASLPQA